MRKPSDFDNVQAFGEFTPLELGGHILVIKKIEESKTDQGKERVIIYFDTHATDKQPNYFTDQYKNDNRPQKRWGGIKTEWPYTAKGETNPFFKAFIQAVEKSNNGFKVQWDEAFATCLVGKLVGGVFGREEYLYNGESKMATKCMSFRSVESIKAGVQVPKDKLLDGSNNGQDDLIQVVDEGEMPF